MRKRPLIYLSPGIALILGVALFTTGCDRSPEFVVDVNTSAADERPEPADQRSTSRWDDDQEADEWGWDSESGQPDPNELAGEFARALASASGDGTASGQLSDFAVDSTPLQLRVELPWQGKEPHQVSASYPSLNEFARCLPWNRGEESLDSSCETDDAMSSALLGFQGSIADSVSFCANGCCRFSVSGPVTDKLKVHELCYDKIDDGRLALTELTLAAQ